MQLPTRSDLVHARTHVSEQLCINLGTYATHAFVDLLTRLGIQTLSLKPQDPDVRILS